MKKIVAVVGSPKGKSSFTGQLVTEFLELVKARMGTIVAETLLLGGNEVGPCNGCFGCAKSGNCMIDDKLTEIQTKIFAADLVIFASPVFSNHVSAQTKALLDRSFIRAHALSLLGKPAITAVTAVYSDMTATENYLDWSLCAFGAIPIGHLRRYQYRTSPLLAEQPDVISLADRTVELLSGKDVPKPTAQNYEYFEMLKEVLPHMPADYAKEKWSSRGWFNMTYAGAMTTVRA